MPSVQDEKTGFDLNGDLYIVDELEILEADGNLEFRDILFRALSLDDQKFEVEKFRRFLRGIVSLPGFTTRSIQAFMVCKCAFLSFCSQKGRFFKCTISALSRNTRLKR